MYLIEPFQEMTTTILGQFLQQFQSKELPVLKRWNNYYNGKQKICFKSSDDPNKVYNKVVTNYCKYIVDNYQGYLTGIPVTYDNDHMEPVLDILNYNDVNSEDSELLKNALIFGKAFELNYIDYDGKQRFKVLDTRSCIDVYDNTLNNNLQYVIRFWQEELDANNQPIYLVEVYGKDKLTKYRSGAGFMSFTLLGEEPLYFKDCPCTVFKLNEEATSIFEQVMTLQDAYNDVLSENLDDFNAFADAYMVIKGMNAEEDDLVDMRKNRILLMDVDSDASYLTKNINDTQVENTLKKINDNIHKIANCPDFTSTDLTVNSGIALRLKLVGFENSTAGIANNFKKALQRRIELICNVLALTGIEAMWRDVEITITRNLPIETENIVSMVNSLRGIVSTRTLLSLLPFVKDVDKELKAVAEENAANMELYSFNTTSTTVEDFNINN